MRRTKLNQAEIVFVEWVDSARTFGWCPAEKGGALVIRSVGILIHEDDDIIVISTSRCSSGNYLDQLTIPRVSIRKMHGDSMKRP